MSYSRAVDGRLAPALEDAVERFAKPWYRMRAVRVFRDDASLSANPGLWSSLQAALGSSAHFVLLGSPGAAQSPWVDREIGYWLEHRGPEQLLIVVTDGEIAWDERAGDFDWDRTTALPRALAGVFDEEPRYVDLRFADREEQLDVRDPAFRRAVADLAAPLHGRDKDELIGEDVRQHRRTIRLARAVAAVLGLFAVAATLAAVLAVRASDQERAERERAEAESARATSRALAARSAAALAQDELDTALTMAAQAWSRERTVEAGDALLAALNSPGRAVGIVHTRVTSAWAASGDRRRVALYGDGRIDLWDVRTGRRLGRPLEVAEPSSMALDRTGQHLAIGTLNRGVRVVRLADRTETIVRPDERRPDGADLEFFSMEIDDLALGPEGRWAAWADDRGAWLWDGGRTVSLAARRVGDMDSVALSPDGRWLVGSADAAAGVAVWRLDDRGRANTPPVIVGRRSLGNDVPNTPPVIVGRRGLGSGALELAVSGGPRPLLAAAAERGPIRLWDLKTRQPRPALRDLSDPSGLMFSPRGDVLAADNGIRAAVWATRGGGPRWGPRELTSDERAEGLNRVHNTEPVLPLDERGRFMMFSARGAIVLRHLRAPRYRLARPLRAASARARAAVFSPDGSRLVSLARSGRLQLWDPATGRAAGAPFGSPLDPADTRLAWLPDGRVVTCCTRVRVWDPARPAVKGTIVNGAPATPYDVAVTAGGEIVVAAGIDGRIGVWRSGGDTLLMQNSGSRGINFASLAPGGRWLLRGGEVWDTATGLRVAEINGAWSATAAGAGPLVAWSTRGDRPGGEAIGVRDLGSSAPSVHVRAADVGVLALSADGRRLARVGLSDVELFDLSRLRSSQGRTLVRQDFQAEFTPEFSPDGRRLVTSGPHGEVLVWEVDEDRWAALACRLANRGLTPAEWRQNVGSARYHPVCPG